MESIKDILFGHNDDEYKKFMEDSLTRMINERIDEKRKVIAYLYLWVSVMENITIRDAFEKYSWFETPVKNDASFKHIDGKCLIDRKETVWGETKITLIPRDYPQVCKTPYREAAMGLAELFKEILRLN